MFIYVVIAVITLNVPCLSISNVVSNSPTHVPKQCLLDVARGTCRDQTRNYFFNVTSGACQPFIYNGCGGNWNRFTQLSECHKTCTCTLPPETGPCRGYVARWFYSPADGCCRPFMYGGCGGNANSYTTWRSCSEACGYPTANSTWWAWGAQWGNATATKSNATYSKNDFMRDWMLWMLFANGGEGFEMEDLAMLITQAHMLGLVNGTGLGNSMGLFGSGRRQGFGGFGAQFNRQGMASGFTNSMFDVDAAEGQGQYGAANWGLNSGSRPGSFTPLGQVGSANNLLPQGNAFDAMFADMDFFGMNMFGGQGGGQLWGNQNQQNTQGEIWNTAAGAGMFGQGQAAGGQNTFNQGSAWDQSGWGTQGGFGQGQQQVTQSQSTVPKFENIAMEILYYIRKLGRGELGQNELFNLGRRFGAVSANGKLNINLLAAEMVRELQGPSTASNMASIQGVAQTVGAVDGNGNINVPMLVNTLTRSMSDNQFSKLLQFGVPSTDEFNWLNKRADVMRTKIGGDGRTSGRNGNQMVGTGAGISGTRGTFSGTGVSSDATSNSGSLLGIVRGGGQFGGSLGAVGGRSGLTGNAGSNSGVDGRFGGVGRGLGIVGDSRSGLMGGAFGNAVGGRGVAGATRGSGNGGRGLIGGAFGSAGRGQGLTGNTGIDGGIGGRFSGIGETSSRGGGSSGNGGRGVTGGAFGGMGSGRGLNGDTGRLAGRGGQHGLGGGIGGIDGISLGGGSRGLNMGGANAGMGGANAGMGGANTGMGGANSGFGGSGFGAGRAAVVVNAGKSTRMGSYGKK